MRNEVGVGRLAYWSTNESLLQRAEGYFVIELLSYFEDRARTIRQLADVRIQTWRQVAIVWGPRTEDRGPRTESNVIELTR